MQTASWASLQLSGVIQLNAGVVLAFCRSWTRPVCGLSRFATWLASQLVPPLDGWFSAGPLTEEPVSDWNHANGKCLATYWSFGCAAVNVVTPAGKLADIWVGLVSGLLAGVPGPAHAAASRSGTVLAWNEVSPGVCAPPMSWA